MCVRSRQGSHAKFVPTTACNFILLCPKKRTSRISRVLLWTPTRRTFYIRKEREKFVISCAVPVVSTNWQRNILNKLPCPSGRLILIAWLMTLKVIWDRGSADGPWWPTIGIGVPYCFGVCFGKVSS